MKIYAIYEYDSDKLETGREYFASEKKRDNRLAERKQYPYGTVKWEIETLVLPRDASKLNAFWDNSKARRLRWQLGEAEEKIKRICDFIKQYY